MIVQPKSKVCPACKMRKVKCDRKTPACSQCVKGGWKCEGYLPAFQRTERSAEQNMVMKTYEHMWELGSEAQSCGEKALPNIKRAKNVFPIQINQHFSPKSPLSCSSSILADRLIFHLNQPTLPGARLQSVCTFFDFVPSRLGQNQALDHAVSCICTAYSSFLGSESSVVHRRREYSQALRSLQACIKDEKKALSSETLCAAILLGWYEILHAEDLNDRGQEHFQGCAILIQLRGPSQHLSGFGRALLLTMEDHISSYALVSNKPSFLDSPPWHDAMRIPVSSPEDLSLQQQLVVDRRMATCSTLMIDLQNFLLTSEPPPKLSSPMGTKLLDRFETLRAQTRAMLADKANSDLCTDIDFRNALLLITLDTGLLTLLSSVGPNTNTDDNKYLTSLNHLEAEIEETLDLLMHAFVTAYKTAPLQKRKMMFLARVFSASVAKRVKKDGESQAGLWRWLDRNLKRMNEDVILGGAVRDRVAL